MNANATAAVLPKDFLLLTEPGFPGPDQPDRPNRLCVCFSDVHFTDGTVGNQSADDVVWGEVFDQIMDQCVDYGVEELTILLVGDVADMIRTARWSEHGVYPWQRDHPQYKPILREIMRGIIGIHARGPDPEHPCQKTGFFYLLKQLPEALKKYDYQNEDRSERKRSVVKHIRTLVFLGNHDKEIVTDDETLRMYYEECLGHTFGAGSENPLSEEYRHWIGQMYFGDASRFADPQSVPWLPFYWGDRGFRLFVTHGQWRDQDNSSPAPAQGGKPGWQVKDGWQLGVWRDLEYQPFTAPCFGDTVAAGVLSGFIYRAKRELDALLNAQPGPTPEQAKELKRLKKILDELDLYRPTSAAVRRIIGETWNLRSRKTRLPSVRKMIEQELLRSIREWLDWPFTLESAAPTRRWLLRIAKPLVNVMSFFGATLELGFLYLVLWGLGKLQQYQRDDPSYKEMLAFPAFLESYRNYGFRIHGEGHTHIPLEEELYFKTPSDHQNYTYINFGAWRDQVLPKQKEKYRRRGVGRILFLLDAKPDPRCDPPGAERPFFYWVQDVVSWSDRADHIDS
jgi:hypothetical protein